MMKWAIILALWVAFNASLCSATDKDIYRFGTEDVVKFHAGESKLLRWAYTFRGEEMELAEFSCGYHNDNGDYVPLAVDFSGKNLSFLYDQTAFHLSSFVIISSNNFSSAWHFYDKCTRRTPKFAR